MHAFVWMAHTLEAAGLACLGVVGLGLFALLRWLVCRPVLSQSQREAMFLAPHVASHEAERRWRWEMLPRDADGFLDIEAMDPCDEAFFYDSMRGAA